MTDKRLDPFDTGFEHGKGIKTSSVTTEKLTLEIAMRYLPNVKVLWNGLIYWAKSMDMYNAMFELCDYDLIGQDTEFYSVPISDCKLQLRPLSGLTEEEKKNYYKLCDKSEMLKFDYNDKVCIITGQSTNDYLRSINIDIDGLQERGIAVYE